MPFKDNLEGQTFSCTHENTNPNGICDKCLPKKVRKIKLYWLRKGKEGFLVSNLWANKENAQDYVKIAKEFSNCVKYKIISCELIIKIK